MTRTALSSLALIAAVAGAASLAGAPAVAAEGVKCYGISMAGANDCANGAGTHSCAGQSTVDYAFDDWKAVASADECTAMHGQLEPGEGVNTMIEG